MNALTILSAARASRSVRRPLKYAASSLLARKTSWSRICCSAVSLCVFARLRDGAIGAVSRRFSGDGSTNGGSRSGHGSKDAPSSDARASLAAGSRPLQLLMQVGRRAGQSSPGCGRGRRPSHRTRQTRRICLSHRRRSSASPSTSTSRLPGQNVGFIQLSDRIWLVNFIHYDLGYFDDETCRLEPIENPFGPKVLPMSTE